MNIIKKTLMPALIIFSLNANSTTCVGNDFRAYDYQYRLAYTAGLWDALEDKYHYCVGSKVQMSQIVDAMNNYLKSKPAKRTNSCTEIFHTIMKIDFECK